MTGFWSDLTEVLTSKSLVRNSTEHDEPVDPNSLTLFQAVRSAIGVLTQDMDCADVAFWEWRVMRPYLMQVWEGLDSVATKTSGRREIASVWVHKPKQTDLDILEFVKKASAHSPYTASLKVNRRPDGFLMINVGKVDSALVSTIAVIVKHSALPYGEILNTLLGRSGSDEDLLTFLDNEVERLGADRTNCDQSPIPREIIRAKQKARDQMALSSLSMTTFLEMLDNSNNLTNIADNALLARLLYIAPEENKAIAKKIELARSTAG